MARTKQATPIRRNPSSEYTSKDDRPVRKLEKALESVKSSSVNGAVLESLVPEAQQKDAGALQFLVAAGGIYGSL